MSESPNATSTNGSSSLAAVVVEYLVLDAQNLRRRLRFGVAPPRELAPSYHMVARVAVGDREELHQMAIADIKARQPTGKKVTIVRMSADDEHA